MQIDFENIFQDYFNANAKEWLHDRSKSVGASEVFDCIRKVWFGKFGEANGFMKDEDEKPWGALERGNIIENNYVVPAVKNHLPEGARLIYAGENQRTFIDEYNSATPDGLIIGLEPDALKKYGIDDIESDCVSFEIKSVDPRVDLAEEKAIHHGQIQVQMGLIRELTKWKPMYGIIIYIDASFLDNITVFVVKFEPEKFKAATTRAKQVFNTLDPKKLHPEGKLSGACKYCEWTAACSAVMESQIPNDDSTNNVSDEIIAELHPLVLEERALQREKDIIEEKHGALRQQLKDKLEHFKKRKIKGKGWSLTWFSQAGKTKTDLKAMEADGIDLTPYQSSGMPFDKLLVKETKIKE